MNRWLTLLVVLVSAGRINGRPQVPPNIIPTGNLVLFLLRPNGQLIYLPAGLSTNLNTLKPPISNPLHIPVSAPLPFPSASNNPTGGSVLPVALWPYFNKFYSSTILNGTYEQNLTTSTTLKNPVSATMMGTREEITFPTVTIPAVDSVVNATQSSASTTSTPSPLSSSGPTAEIESNGDYSFSYHVNDLETGDIKSQEEKRVDGVVTGYYMLAEADGTLRKVNYTADSVRGFRATVSKLPLPSHQTIN